jgi:hypothetical protein
MKEYIEREAAINAVLVGDIDKNFPCMDIAARLHDIPAADVLPRDEAIKMGAELAAMHGSDATSQQLEEAYLKGVEYGMTRRDVRPVVRCRDCKFRSNEWTGCPKLNGTITGDEFFCAAGKKREES